MTVFFTIVAGVATLALGQIFLRLILEPVHSLKRTIADIAIALIQYANVYGNPGIHGHEKESEAAREIRLLASKLNAQLYLVPSYPTLQRVFGLPAESNVMQSVTYLIGISNSVHTGAEDMATVNGEKSDKIRKLLDIHSLD